MRHSMRALFGAMLVGWLWCSTMAAESSRKWWHFGQGREPDVTAPATSLAPPPMSQQIVEPQTPPQQFSQTTNAPAAATIDQPSTLPTDTGVEQPEPRWMISSPLAKVSWPRLHMPELPRPALPTTPWPTKSEANPDRNAWAEPDTTPVNPTPMEAMSNGARRVGQRTRAAWQRTVDAMTPGDEPPSSDPSSRVAGRDDRVPVWQKMFGSSEPPPQGPQTVGEFIAQERIDP
jgi:hypothetical protein